MPRHLCHSRPYRAADDGGGCQGRGCGGRLAAHTSSRGTRPPPRRRGGPPVHPTWPPARREPRGGGIGVGPRPSGVGGWAGEGVEASTAARRAFAVARQAQRGTDTRTGHLCPRSPPPLFLFFRRRVPVRVIPRLVLSGGIAAGGGRKFIPSLSRTLPAPAGCPCRWGGAGISIMGGERADVPDGGLFFFACYGRGADGMEG